ncbi:hypothetical protein AB8A31_26930 [Tardiphaga sp. 804_B3_N1_9]|uniref:hypothetical protein n=1 Tax=Tardiphaga TaxID=1395974 RepID=UPI001586BC74|nr:hypothetical protein [Tardiphaga robiniae]NUU41510.1 hypothetical protein [Tardiphaga robiniae]
MTRYGQLLGVLLPSIWRQKGIVVSSIVVVSLLTLMAYATIGERYESYTLLRVGQGIKDRSSGASVNPFAEGADLSIRIDSLARLVTTDHVVREAASSTGFDRFNKGRDNSLMASMSKTIGSIDLSRLLPKSVAEALASWSKPADTNEASDQAPSKEATLVASLRDLITAKQEGRSDLLRISFRYPDAAVATRFLTELANALVAVQADLVQTPGADIFFEDQTRRLQLEAEKSATELQNFSVGAAIYSVAEQRALLLKRANELSTLISTTRAQIQDRKGQKQSIVDQLLILKPVQQSKTVTGIVNSLGARDYPVTPNAAGTPQNFEETPPLLLIKVYQDAVATLFKVNTDLNGSMKLESLLADELEHVNAELASLSSKESQYDQLKRALVRASTAADHYGARVIEEKINLDIAKKTQLSSVRVIQAADRPLRPIFPQRFHFVLLALFGGMIAGSAIIIMKELSRLRQDQYELEERELAMNEIGIRSVREYKAALKAAQAAE